MTTSDALTDHPDESGTTDDNLAQRTLKAEDLCDRMANVLTTLTYYRTAILRKEFVVDSLTLRELLDEAEKLVKEAETKYE